MTKSHGSNALHLIADIRARHGLGDPDFVAEVLREAAAAAHVTLLDLRLHHFGAGNGVTGVALLAESHISIHTWPENDLAAVDIFVCGANADPTAALDCLVSRFKGTLLTCERIERLLGV